MPTNQELANQVIELQEELEALRQKESPTDDFSREVWKAVLVGSCSALFDPSRVPIASSPKALDQYLKRALLVADRAAEIAKNHRDFQDREEDARVMNAPDPLKQLLQDQNADLLENDISNLADIP